MAIIIGTEQSDIVNSFSVSEGVTGGPPGSGPDLIVMGDGADRVSAAGPDLVFGGRGNDTLQGGGANDLLSGDAGDDDLAGREGNDILLGGGGCDRLEGGFGVDLMFGGRNADLFVFGTVAGSRSGIIYLIDTGIGEGARDVIGDFQQGKDVIDLGLVNSSGPQASLTEIVIPAIDLVFEFIGTDAFTGEGGPQLRYEIIDGRTIVQMDGLRDPSGPGTFPLDGIVDAEIELIGCIHLTARDFIL